MTWKLSAPRDFGWKMKTLDSAKTEFVIDENNVFHLTIRHDLIRGVTPKMLDWWFRNIGGEMTYQGKKYSRYLVWHPIDHIHWHLAKNFRKDGSVGVGSYFRIVEAFGGDLKQLVDSTEEVTKLDETGIKLERRIFGDPIFSLEHKFLAVGNDSTQYDSKMIVGSDSFFGRFVFNPLIRPKIFTEQMGRSWLKHNIEEVGNFEFFLPQLYKENH